MGGLLVDLATGAPLGMSVLPFLAAVLIASVGFARVYRANLVLPAFITLAALLVYQASYLVLAAIVGRTVLWEQIIQQVLLPWLILHLALDAPDLPGSILAGGSDRQPQFALWRLIVQASRMRTYFEILEPEEPMLHRLPARSPGSGSFTWQSWPSS